MPTGGTELGDFRHVHGAGHDPQSLFARENAELKAQLQALNQEMISRAAPVVGNLIDTLNNLIAGSRQGNPQARAVLTTFVRTMDAAREATPPLTVVKNGQ